MPTANVGVQRTTNSYLGRLRHKLLIAYPFTGLISAQLNQSMFNHNLNLQTSARADGMLFLFEPGKVRGKVKFSVGQAGEIIFIS